MQNNKNNNVSDGTPDKESPVNVTNETVNETADNKVEDDTVVLDETLAETSESETVFDSDPVVAPTLRPRKQPKKQVLAIGVVVLALIAGGSAIGYNQYVNATTTIVPETVAYIGGDNPTETSDLCQKFETANLNCTVTWNANDNVRRGALVSQTVKTGERVKKDTPINLVYSKGPSVSEFPNLNGTNLEEAKDKLYAIGVEIEEISIVDSNGRAENTVVRSSVEAGESVKNGSKVVLEVSNGKVTVPDWNGKTREFVEADAKKLGITVEFKREESEKASGIVLSQTPKAGEVDTTTEVVVVISTTFESKELTVPDVVGKSAEEAQVQLATTGFRHIKTVIVKNSEVTSKQVTQVVPAVGQTGGSEENVVLIVSEPYTK